MNKKTILIIILLIIVIIGVILLIKFRTTGQAIALTTGYTCDGNDLIFRQSSGIVKTRFPCSSWSTGGCYNGQCMAGPIDDNTGKLPCEKPGWTCIGNYKLYISTDCRLQTPEYCDYGCVTTNTTATCKFAPPTCADTDSSSSPFVKGKVSGVYEGNQYENSDECKLNQYTRVNQVVEWSCESGIASSKANNCPSGYSCFDGVCNTTNQVKTCTDSDLNNNNIKGYVEGRLINGQNYTKWDSCSSASIVGEWTCSNSDPVIISQSCATGYLCQDGACKAATTGSLILTSEPSSANVTIDYIRRGLTPITVSGLSIGQHDINISKTGYYDYVGLKNITAGSNTLFVNLTKII